MTLEGRIEAIPTIVSSLSSLLNSGSAMGVVAWGTKRHRTDTRRSARRLTGPRTMSLQIVAFFSRMSIYWDGDHVVYQKAPAPCALPYLSVVSALACMYCSCESCDFTASCRRGRRYTVDLVGPSRLRAEATRQKFNHIDCHHQQHDHDDESTTTATDTATSTTTTTTTNNGGPWRAPSCGSSIVEDLSTSAGMHGLPVARTISRALAHTWTQTPWTPALHRLRLAGGVQARRCRGT
jgi:hypothetical protein